MGAARELWEETGIDLRSQLDRIAPAVLRVSTKSSPSDPSGILDNELNHKLFFLVTVTDQDFEDLSETGVQAMGTELTDCMYKDIKVHFALSCE